VAFAHKGAKRTGVDVGLKGAPGAWNVPYMMRWMSRNSSRGRRSLFSPPAPGVELIRVSHIPVVVDATKAVLCFTDGV